jgi:hypothetical protein
MYKYADTTIIRIVAPIFLQAKNPIRLLGTKTLDAKKARMELARLAKGPCAILLAISLHRVVELH